MNGNVTVYGSYPSVANTEKIQDYLLYSKEMSDKTVIIITHDVSQETLARYDNIVRVDEFHH